MCGPFAYQITEGYSFAPVSYAASPGTITVSTNLIADASTHTATFDAYLVNYPAATHAQITFTIDIINPCLTAVIQTQTLGTPVDYQILQPLPNFQSVLPIPMHEDSVGQFFTDPVKCGVKHYTASVAWASIRAPADPLTTDF